MTRFYLVANRIGGGGSNSPRVFKPFGIFDTIKDANSCILSLDNFRDLGIIILDSQAESHFNSKLNDSEKQFSIQCLFNNIQIPVLKDEKVDNRMYLVTSTSYVETDGFYSFCPEFCLNFHGIFDKIYDAQSYIETIEIDESNNSKYSSLPIITQTFVNPAIGNPIAILAQHYDINLLTNGVNKTYKLTVKFEYLDVIQTSVLESIYPYFAYTNVNPSIENIDDYVKQLVIDNRIQALHNAAKLIFTARNWDKAELKKYLFAQFNEETNDINFHLIDYPDQKTKFDNDRVYMNQQLICNFINDQEKTQERLDQQSQAKLLQMMIDLHPKRF
jgi:hypothetical protein